MLNNNNKNQHKKYDNHNIKHLYNITISYKYQISIKMLSTEKLQLESGVIFGETDIIMAASINKLTELKPIFTTNLAYISTEINPG